MQKMGHVMPNSFYHDKTAVTKPGMAKEQIVSDTRRQILSEHQERLRTDDRKTEV